MMTEVIPKKALRLNGKIVPADKPVHVPPGIAEVWVAGGLAIVADVPAAGDQDKSTDARRKR